MREGTIVTVDELAAELRDRVSFEVPSDLNPYDDLADLGFDSLHLVEFLAVTEELTGVKQLPELNVVPTTLADLLDYYWSCVQAAGRPGTLSTDPSILLVRNEQLAEDDTVYSVAISQKDRLVRPVFPSDYDALYHLAIDAGPTWQWTSSGPSPSSLEQSLWDDVLLQYVLLGVEGEFAGIAAIEHANLLHGWANIRVHIIPQYRSRGWILRGVAVLIEEAFEKHGLHNIYSISAGDDFLVGAESAIFEREATFKGKLRAGRTRTDQVVRTLSYERWQDLRQRVSTWLP